jgi:hypothetical protein
MRKSAPASGKETMIRTAEATTRAIRGKELPWAPLMASEWRPQNGMEGEKKLGKI